MRHCNQTRRTHFCNAVNRQYGFASLTAITLALLLFSLTLQYAIKSKDSQLDSQETVYFAQVKNKVITCMETILPLQNGFYATTTLGATFDAQVVGLCGLPTAKNVSYQVSNVISRNSVSYRTISYWIGPYDKQDATTFNRVTGILTLDPSAIGGDTYSSYQVDYQRLLDTNHQLNSIAIMHQKRFNALYNASGDAGYNFFRAADCLNVTLGEIPCSDTAMGGTNGWKSLNTINNQTVFSDMSAYANTWGIAINYCNTPECGASLSSPFSIVFSTTTPWGLAVSINAMQNI
jgi:hypothetical protein